jgi:hypothetical protein
MARTREIRRRDEPGCLRRWFALAARLAAVALGGAAALVGASASTAAATAPATLDGPTSASWCSAHGSTLSGWTETVPDLPICGPGPEYGGSWNYVDVPGPGGTTVGYYNATPGFQCVELAERFLAVVYGLAPVHADGESVAANYHAAYPDTELYVNGSAGAVGHAPEPGDVLSLSVDPSFASSNDGHVAVVVRSDVDHSTGDGTIVVAQENVASTDYLKTIDVVGWRLEDPAEPADPEYQFADGEWLHIGPMPSAEAAAAALARRADGRSIYLLARSGRVGIVAMASLASAVRSTARSRFVSGAPQIVTAGLGLPVAGSAARLGVGGA